MYAALGTRVWRLPLLPALVRPFVRGEAARREVDRLAAVTDELLLWRRQVVDEVAPQLIRVRPVLVALRATDPRLLLWC